MLPRTYNLEFGQNVQVKNASKVGREKKTGRFKLSRHVRRSQQTSASTSRPHTSPLEVILFWRLWALFSCPAHVKGKVQSSCTHGLSFPFGNFVGERSPVFENKALCGPDPLTGLTSQPLSCTRSSPLRHNYYKQLFKDWESWTEIHGHFEKVFC